MRKLKTGLLAVTLATGVCFLTGCGQVDETFLETPADFSVNISVPYSTTTPLPEHLNVPDQVVIDANGGVTVNDKSLLNSSYTMTQESESQYTTLSLGNTNDAVKTLQRRLSELGYFTGGISGVFDAETQSAVKKFEQSFGIMQTGIATPALQSKLFSSEATIYGSDAYNSAVVAQYTTLQRGATGSSVYALQQRLKELGYPITELTGVYDDTTARAVELFGAAYGLEAQSVAYIALQQELYSENAAPYAAGGSVQQQNSSGLSVGSVGTLVMQMQTRLIYLGYLSGNATGVYDSETEAAVMLFEQACGIDPTGTLNTELQNILLSENAPVFGTYYNPNNTTYTDLAEGSEGDAVRELQDRLIELGYASGAGNGIYGPETSAAVSMFQHYNALAVTGAASADMQQYLFSPAALSYQDIQDGITAATPAPSEVPGTPLPDESPTPKPQPTVDPLTGMRTLIIGCTGEDVRQLQARLNKLGYSCVADGSYGEATASALRAFQASIGVSQTGEATSSMQKYIQTKAAPAKKYKLFNSTQDFVSLQLSDTGEAVSRLQKKLWELGYLLTEDIEGNEGTFHMKTYDAVVSAQRAMGYTSPDGIASPEFQCFIFSDYNEFIKK